MKRSQLSRYAREVLSMAEVHLRSDERGMIAAMLLKETRLSSVVREFVDCLSVEQRSDLLEYLQTGAFAGEYWVWQEPLKLLPCDVPVDPPADPAKRPGKKKGGGGNGEN